MQGLVSDSDATMWRTRVVALYRRVLSRVIRLYPKRFRHAYGADMVELFEVRCVEVWEQDGAMAATDLFRRNFVDMCATAVAERRNSSFETDSDRRSFHDPSSRSQGAASRGQLPNNGPLPRRSTGDGLAMSFLHDVRHAVRGFARQPGFTVVVVITLALGIGANTAIFSVVNGVLLRPLPYDDPDQLINVWGRFVPISGFDFPTFPLSPPEWVDYRAQSTAMDDVAAFFPSAATLTGSDGEPERVTTAPVSYNLFDILRAQPSLGRTFTAEEDRVDAKVVLLEYGYWQSRFGGDRDLIGDTITLDGEPWTVLGVMPEGFQFVRNAKMWLPAGINPEDPGNRKAHWIRSFGRLAPGATLEQAQAEMATLMSAWETEFPDTHTGHYLYLSSMMNDAVGSVRSALLLLLGASGFILLIVCANVASVVLARGEDRVREIAIRSAIGADRLQILRLLLSESIVLSLAGGLLGVLLAYAGMEFLLDLSAGGIPRADGVGIDAGVLLFAGAATLLTAFLFGLFPALHSAATDVQSNLKDGTRGGGVSRGRLYFRRGLVVAQVALSFLLVLGAGLMIKSFSTLLSVDPGYRTNGMLVARVALPTARYGEPQRVNAFYEELLDRVQAVAGVESASAAASFPLNSTPGAYDFRREGKELPADGEPAWNASFSAVRTGFFETMGVALQRGRVFHASDQADSLLVTVINESMAQKFFAGEDPLGKRLMLCCARDEQEEPWMTVVGIVDDMRYRGLGTEPRPAYYAVHSQAPKVDYGSVYRSMMIVMRTSGDPVAAAPAFRNIVRDLDASLPVIGLQTMEDVVATSVARPRFTAMLLGLFAAVALILGASGIYGMLAYMVAQRTREIGIRRALGAQSTSLAGTIVLQGMSLVGAGLVIGAATSFWATRVLSSMLFGVSPLDAVTYVVVFLVLGLVALVACCVPTLRAVRIDPLVALRAE